jgi:hypothetical protein
MKGKWAISILLAISLLVVLEGTPASADGRELKEFRQPEIAKAK